MNRNKLFKCILSLGLIFIYFNGFSQLYIKQVDSLKNNLQNLQGIEKIITLNKLSEYYWKINTSASLNYANEALNKAMYLNNNDNIALAYNNIARCYYYYDNLEQAFNFAYKSLIISQQNNFQKGIGQSLNSLGLMHRRIGDYYKAIKELTEAQNIFNKINDIPHLASVVNNLGIIYCEKSNYKQGLTNYEKALKLNEQIGDKLKVAVAINNIGYVYELTGNLKKSMVYYNKAIILADSLHSTWDYINVLINIGRVNYKNKYYRRAINNLEEAQKLARKINAKTHIKESASYLAAIFSDLKNYRLAAKYFKMLSEVKDSILNEKKAERIFDIQTQFGNNKKEKQIRELQQDKIMSTLEIKKQKHLLFFIIPSTILILIILFFLFNAYYSKRKINLLLAKRNSEIINKNKEIEKQTENMNSINEELKKLTIVARETNNSVVILDSNFNFIWINKGFTRMFGFTLDQLVSERGKNLLEVSGEKEIYQKLKNVLSDKKTIIYNSQNTKRNGDKLWTQTTITPVVDKNGVVSQLVLIDSDISKLKQAEKEIVTQHDEISLQKKEITDSIIYAKRIQTAILPTEQNVRKIIPKSFILYKPREIIGGDFYWISKKQDEIIVAVADCTGHGVPGALMSMLGVTLLNEIVNNKGIIIPGEILNELREQTIEILHQTVDDGHNDGMDIAICCFNLKTKQLRFSSANSPAILVTENRVMELKPDKMPIGLFHIKNKSFFTQQIDLSQNETVYLYTDGFVDQFGGKHEKKFYRKNLIKLIKRISSEPIAKQKAIFEQTLDDWKGNIPQIDDITILGFRV
ncbi:MAG: tetratricopeptide repeat protein [Chlorobi bacterium]|nr:tetratricopeptide repeat protein [Chlorobiota bacterium]